MLMLSTMTISLVNSGRSARYVGVQLLMVYLIFAMTFIRSPATR
jgi:Ca2+/H+ antiporter